MVNTIALNAKPDTKTGKGSDRLLGGHIGAHRRPATAPSTPTTPTPQDDGRPDAVQSPPDGAVRAVGVAGGDLRPDRRQGRHPHLLGGLGRGRRRHRRRPRSPASRPCSTTPTPTTSRPRSTSSSTGLRDNLNDSITRDDAIEHARPAPDHQAGVRRPVRGHDFAAHNPVSQVMQTHARHPRRRTAWKPRPRHLEGFYDSVRIRAGGIDQRRGQAADHRRAVREVLQDRLPEDRPRRSASSTPRSRSSTSSSAPPTRACATHFGRGLTDEGVHVLDRFTGTGTFITRLLQSGLITPDDLPASTPASCTPTRSCCSPTTSPPSTSRPPTTPSPADREPTLRAVRRASSSPTPSRSPKPATAWTRSMFPQNNDASCVSCDAPHRRHRRQPALLGRAGQRQRRQRQPQVPDARRADRARPTPRGPPRRTKNSLYDSYIRAIRWATDRIGDAGRRRFVTNGGYIDGNTADGIRADPRRRVSPHLRLQPARQPAHRRRAVAQGRRQGLRLRQPQHRRHLPRCQGPQRIPGRARFTTATSATTSPAKRNSASSPTPTSTPSTGRPSPRMHTATGSTSATKNSRHGRRSATRRHCPAQAASSQRTREG